MIGLAGATGRVNGPHLHWGVKVGGVMVDPLNTLQAHNSLFAKDTAGTAAVSNIPTTLE